MPKRSALPRSNGLAAKAARPYWLGSRIPARCPVWDVRRPKPSPLGLALGLDAFWAVAGSNPLHRDEIVKLGNLKVSQFSNFGIGLLMSTFFIL